MPEWWDPQTQELEDNVKLKSVEWWRDDTKAPTDWTSNPIEMPKVWWGQAEEKIAEGISKVPILPEILKPVGTVFSWVHENLEKPFAAIVTSPFSPSLEWKQGESWLDHQKREYDEWEAPTYVKGVAEFAMPLWWMPWFGWAAKGAKSLGIGGKALSAISKTGKALKVSERGLPAGELLDNVLFRAGTVRSAMEYVPIVNKIIKMVGGEGAFITRKEALRVSGLTKAGVKLSPVDALTRTKMELVKLGFISDMRNGIKSIHVPKLQVMGDQSKLLGMDAKGVVSNIVDKSGKSQYLYDVLEGAIKNPDNYKFLTKEARQYVETLGTVIDDTFKLARKEGVKVPKETIVHRIVKGKTGPAGYEATEYGSLFEARRVHKTMVDGIKAGVDYGLDINESISSTMDHYVRAIARKRFEKEVGKLGKRPVDIWEALPESSELHLLQASVKEGVLNNPERLAELTLMKKDFLNRFRGSKQILGEHMAKFSRHPAFKNSIFPKDVVKTTEKLLMDEGQEWLRQAANVSGMSRMLTAAMDLSAPFIQGAAVWGRNPLAWTKGVKNMLEFAFDPQNYYKYLTSPNVSAVRMERILHGGSSSTFEYFKALAPLQRGAGKIPVAGRGIKAAIAQSWGRAETAFTGFGEVARNEMWKALRKPNMTDDMLMDLSRTVDRMTGVMSTEALAIGRSQQDFENAFVFFAPRYTRAGLAFAGDALKGGMVGAEARKSLISLMLAGTVFYYGATKALGQQPNFNPNSGRFMTIQVGESHIGVGGIMTAMLRLAYDVYITAVEDPVNLIKPLSEGHLNRWDNPFVKFLYSRTAPLTSLITSAAIEQTNYFGEPFESVGDWATFMKDKVTPIALQNVMRDPQVAVMAAEFGGLRAFPKSTWELLDEERNKVSQTEFNDLYDNLNDLQKMQVNKQDIIIKLQRDVDSQTVTRGDAVSVSFLNWQREKDAARQTYEETLDNLQRAYDAGVITGADFRERMADAGYGLGVTYEHINKQPEYKDVMDVLAKPRSLTDKTVGDIAYAEFMDKLYGQKEFTDQYGLFNYDAYNQFIDQFRSKWGDGVWEYIQSLRAERDSGLPPLAKEYQIAKEILKPYWNVANEVKAMGINPDGNAGQRIIQRRRKIMRLTNPELNKYYVMFFSRNGT